MAMPESSTPQPPWLSGRLARSAGLDIMAHLSRDAKLLIIQRFVRLFGYGLTTLIMVQFMARLGHSESAVGLFMTLTTLGDVVISLLLAMISDRMGRRRVLALGALGVVGCGLVFATCRNYYALLFAGIVGVVTPTGSEIGPFKAIEESILCHLTDMSGRPRVLALYYMLGAVGSALGYVTSGWTLELLQESLDPLASYRVVFGIYAAIGLVKLYLCCSMSVACELQPQEQALAAAEGIQLLSPEEPFQEGKIPERTTLLTQLQDLIPSFERESKSFIIKLGCIFLSDQIANGLLSNSWLTYFYTYKFQLREDLNGLLFFASLMLSAVSNLFASHLTQRLGFVPAMLASHFPSTIGSALIPIPKTVVGTLPWFALRSAMVDMNQVPRSSFIAAALLPDERTPAMGIFQVIKTSGGTIGPYVAGILVDKDLFLWVFEVYAGLRILYEILLAVFFLGYRTRAERASDTDAANYVDPADAEDGSR